MNNDNDKNNQAKAVQRASRKKTPNGAATPAKGFCQVCGVMLERIFRNLNAEFCKECNPYWIVVRKR